MAQVRKVNGNELRETILNRLMKGDAFRLDNKEYLEKREKITKQLDTMTPESIIAHWPHHCYDIKLK